MMDGSLESDGKTPASYEYNVAMTKRVVEFAHDVDVSVEGELGCLGSLETGKGEAEDGHGFEGELSKDMLHASGTQVLSRNQKRFAPIELQAFEARQDLWEGEFVLP